MKVLLALTMLCTATVACSDSPDESPEDASTGRQDAGTPRVDAKVTITEPITGSKRDAASEASTPIDDSGEDCSGAAKLVYVVDQQTAMLASFRPDKLEFIDIGVLACESGGTPYSMSVDRQGRAWVLYNSGKLYNVDTDDATCSPIARPVGDQGFTTFGMGFVALDGDAAQDRLFIAGSGPLMLFAPTPASSLGVIDPSSLGTSKLGALDGTRPELTGTGDGKLWAYYPQDTPPALKRLDPSTAATLESHPLNEIGNQAVRAYAIAFWGGDFYVFLDSFSADSTTVYRIDGKTFAQKAVLTGTGRHVIGAGVSTCAPLVLLL